MDEPQHHDVSRDTKEHVNELQAQIPNEHSRHVFAMLIHCHLIVRVVDGSLKDVDHRGIYVENLHEDQMRDCSRQKTPARETKICQINTSDSSVRDSRQTPSDKVIMLYKNLTGVIL